jgi:predicted nucleic acid-binding protein
LIRYLIDTNVVSELREPKPHGAAVAWLQSLELGQGFFSAGPATAGRYGEQQEF